MLSRASRSTVCLRRWISRRKSASSLSARDTRSVRSRPTAATSFDTACSWASNASRAAAAAVSASSRPSRATACALLATERARDAFSSAVSYSRRSAATAAVRSTCSSLARCTCTLTASVLSCSLLRWRFASVVRAYFHSLKAWRMSSSSRSCAWRSRSMRSCARRSSSARCSVNSALMPSLSRATLASSFFWMPSARCSSFCSSCLSCARAMISSSCSFTCASISCSSSAICSSSLKRARRRAGSRGAPSTAGPDNKRGRPAHLRARRSFSSCSRLRIFWTCFSTSLRSGTICSARCLALERMNMCSSVTFPYILTTCGAHRACCRAYDVESKGAVTMTARQAPAESARRMLRTCPARNSPIWVMVALHWSPTPDNQTSD